MKRLILLCLASVTLAGAARGQARDTTRVPRDSIARSLEGVRVVGDPTARIVRVAPRLAAGILTTGARSEVVPVSASTAHVAEKVGRQVFSEVPGAFVYDMDGAGNQVNVAVRGLDAHRSWEFNVRQNGVLTTSDLYAYPASHYSMPLEAVERVELIRGTASLQYGSQFGGLLNYVLRAPDTARRVSLETQATIGGFGLQSLYEAIGGRVGRVTYTAYGSARRSDGFRASGASRYDAQYVGVWMPLHRSLVLRAEAGRSSYRYQLPGPLTDGMFEANPRQATRSRNWYRPDITVPSITLTWTPDSLWRSTLVLSAVFGDRSSVAVGGFATLADTPGVSGVWSTRQVDVDRYDSRSLEWRLQRVIRQEAVRHTLSVGLALTGNDTHRRQQGTGSRGADYSLALEPGGDFRRDVHYRTRNVAAFAEGEIAVTPRWTVVPGIRVERGNTRLSGRLAYYDPADTPQEIRHMFPLFGVRTAVVLSPDAEWYGGWSQAFRPMILKDALPESATERADPGLRDARGWTMESGVRGRWGPRVDLDVGGFFMRYENRFGLVTTVDAGGVPYTLRANTGTTHTVGLEVRGAWSVGALMRHAWRLSLANSLMQARYRRGSAIRAGLNVDIRGNEVESVPRWITRVALSGVGPNGTVRWQVSRVSRTFADALNTVAPSATGAVGLVPGYTLVDLMASRSIARDLELSAGANNLLNTMYFTKRPQFYPGAGVWPSDGRSGHLTLRWTPGGSRVRGRAGAAPYGA